MKEMSQLYSRVFLQILDSSIAEDYTMRHVFEDFLKLADHKTGIVDMTRTALSRRLNIPIDILNIKIEALESPDLSSRDNEFEGRRIKRLDDHRDWGWTILNWEKYESIRSKADVYLRVAKHRAKERDPIDGKPDESMIKAWLAEAKKNGADYTEKETRSAFLALSANGWMWGKNPVVDYRSALERQIQSDRQRGESKTSRKNRGPNI